MASVESVDLDGIHGEVSGSGREFEIVMSGQLTGTLSAYVIDFGEGAAFCFDGEPPRLGVIMASVLEEHRALRSPWHDFSDNSWSREDRAATAIALVSVIRSEGDIEPVPTEAFPGPFDLPEIEPWTVTWEGPDEFIYRCPNLVSDHSDEELGQYRGQVMVSGHQASWFAYFLDNMFHSPDEDGWAAWTSDLLLIAGVSDDLDDRGYLCFRLKAPTPAIGTPEWDRWRVALARAITMRGDADGSHPLEYAFMPFADD